MRIPFDGHGQGQVTRAACDIPRLARRHEVLLLIGGDSLAALESVHEVHPILSLGYLCRGARVSPSETLRQNGPCFFDAHFGSATRRMAETPVASEAIERFAAEPCGDRAEPRRAP